MGGMTTEQQPANSKAITKLIKKKEDEEKTISMSTSIHTRIILELDQMHDRIHRYTHHTHTHIPHDTRTHIL